MKLLLGSVLCLVFLGIANAQSQLKPPTESAMDRFLRYVKIDTQSQEDQTTTPSTRKQLNLANLLAKELTALGAQNVRVSEFGIAEIMTMIDTLRQNPQIKHGTLAIAFTPDEEVGTGIEKFDVKGFGAKVAYTVDGEELGEISDETWSARTATVTFQGKSTHPGTAKGIMVNAMYAIGDYLSRFPKDMLPETTEGRVGFVHPYAGVIDVESSNVKVLLRDFDISGLDAKEKMLRDMMAQTAAKFPEVKITIDVKENYKNMKEVLKNFPELTNNAMEAAKRAGLKPFLKPIRGGTDGSQLTFQGLPTPNLFTGGGNFHGKLEFNSRRGLEKSTETLIHLVQIFAEKS